LETNVKSEALHMVIEWILLKLKILKELSKEILALFSRLGWMQKIDDNEFNDEDKKYPCPSFKKYNNPYDISNKEDVRSTLKNNVFDNLHLITTSKRPIKVFKRISIEDEVKGEPDFIYKRIGKLLLPIE
ncbi:18550_t:CDS:2, partial [Racocetra fulgida]